MRPSPWFPLNKKDLQGRLRLFCLPYAGGGASLYRPWLKALPSEIEVWPIQPPGRETRWSEGAHTRARELAAEVAQALTPFLDRPFALFGHSMGAVVAYEVARALKQAAQPSPAHLLVAAHRAPHLPSGRPPTYALPDEELIRYLRLLDGTPEEVFQQPELVGLMLPLLRRDFELVETYAHVPGPPLDCPLTVFGGSADPEVPPSTLSPWAEHSRRFAGVHGLEGGHFFITTAQAELLRRVEAALTGSG